MNDGFLIEALSERHDRRGFSCGAGTLDRYFRELVGQDVRRRVATCFVVCDAAGTVAGHYTFAAAGIPVTDLPAEQARRLPRYPVVPAGLIGRLAVDERYKGQGLGAAMIVDALDRAMRAEIGISVLLVDAKDESAKAFYRHLGFIPLLSRPSSLFLPVARVTKRKDMA